MDLVQPVFRKLHWHQFVIQNGCGHRADNWGCKPIHNLFYYPGVFAFQDDDQNAKTQ